MKQFDDHWAFQPGEHFRYNAGLVAIQGKAFLLDPGMTRNEIHDIQAFLANSGLKCEGIILTHFHWDHIMGVNDFGNVDIFTHKKFPGEIKAHLQDAHRAIVKWAAESNEEAISTEDFPVPVHQLDDGSHLRVGDMDLVIYHTPGHTSDHISIFEESTGVLWAGDILSDVEIPYISSSILAFEKSLEKISELSPTAIIPGHGSPTSDQAEAHKRVAEDLEYLHSLLARVKSAIHQGASMEETVILCRDMPFRFPGDNSLAHQWNVESVYKELGGIASIRPVGWEKE